VRRLATALSLLAVITLIATGCSSSSSSTSATTAAAKSSPGLQAGLQEAQALVAAHLARPTSIGISVPITKPIPTGKKVVFISCGTYSCALQGQIIAQGAKDLGWTSSTIVTDGTAPQIQAAMTSAIRSGANGIILNATPISEFRPELNQAVAQHILFAECCTTDPVGNGLMYVTVTAQDDATIGTLLSAWVASDSHGTAHALWVKEAFPIVAPMATAFQAGLQKFCDGGCQYNELDAAITDTTSEIITRIVTFLRAHPDVKYVGLDVDGAEGIGLPAALKLAGITDVKIVGEGATSQVFGYIASGDPEWVDVPFDYYTTDYQMLDAFARKWAGVPVVPPAPWHWWLLTKASLPANYSYLFPLVANYQQDFLKLWGKG
jgi:ABC-type sugar transport system substrate-binding protein